jgi:hypothetical protein
MSKLWVNGIALMLLLIPFVLISIGTMRETPALWWTGLVLLVIGALIPPITRYVPGNGDGNGDGGDEEDGGGDEEDGGIRSGEGERDEGSGDYGNSNDNGRDR